MKVRSAVPAEHLPAVGEHDRAGRVTLRLRRRPDRVASVFASLLLAFSVSTLHAQAATSGPSAAATPRIAYVDMKRLLDNAPQVAAGRERLAREFRERDAQLKEQESRLADLKRRRQSPPAGADTVQMDREIATLSRGIDRLRTQLRSELGTRGAEELGQRWPEIQAAIVDYAREQRYDLVLQGPVLFAAASIDITDRILERLRALPVKASPEPLVP